MTATEFIADVSWPLAIVIVAVLYRPFLTKLLAGGSSKLKAGPFELAWDEAREGLASTIGRSTDEASDGFPQSSSTSSSGDPLPSMKSLLGPKMVELAEKEPRRAIIQAYQKVSGAVHAGVKLSDAELDDVDDPVNVARRAQELGLIEPRTTDALVGLQVLYNLAEFSPSHQVSSARAFEYLALADAALFAFASNIQAEAKRRDTEDQ